MPATDLIEHRLSIHRNLIPSIAKPVPYTNEEIQYQKKDLLELTKVGTITQCHSPSSARSTFERKDTGGLRMVYAFCSLNDATIRTNVPIRRIEPILNKMAQRWVKYCFWCDAVNRFFAIPLYLPHACKISFSSYIEQFCYLSMGQGCTGGPATYTKLKDVVTGVIPESSPEPALADTDLGLVCFDHYVDNNAGGANTSDNLIYFIHNHYSPRLMWAKITLNPSKCKFFVLSFEMLRHQKDLTGIRPSVNKLRMFREWPTPTLKELERFFYILPYLRTYIPERADCMLFLRSAIIEGLVTFKVSGWQKTTKTVKDFI